VAQWRARVIRGLAASLICLGAVLVSKSNAASISSTSKAAMHLQKLSLVATAAIFVLSATASSAETAVSEVALGKDDLVIQGQHLYEHNCSHCHGPNMVNAGTVAFDLRKFPHNDKDRFIDSVTNGKNGRMPSWGDILTATDIDKLWAYISNYKQQ
jgi:mono/diheme cytochrome c family protein